MPMCQASLLGVSYSLPSPEALPQQDGEAQRQCSSRDDTLFSFLLLFLHKHPPTDPSKFNHSPSCPRHGGKSPLQPARPLWQLLEGDPRLFFLFLVGWLAGSGATRHALASAPRLDRFVQRLMNCRRDAERQPARRSGKQPSCTITVRSCDGGNQRDRTDNLI